jgi:hypothetical protein
VGLTKKELFYVTALLAVIGKEIIDTVQIKKMEKQLEITTDQFEKIHEVITISKDIIDINERRFDNLEERFSNVMDMIGILKEAFDSLKVDKGVIKAVVGEETKSLKGEINELKKELQAQKGMLKELRKKEVKTDVTNEDLKKKWANMPPQEAKSKMKRLIYQLGDNPANAFSDEKIIEIMNTRHGVEPWITEYLLKERDRAEKYYETLSLKLDWDNLSENDKERLAEIISYVSIDHDGFMSTENIKRDFKKRFNGKPSVILEAKALADKKRDELYEKGELVFPPKRG